MIRTALLSIICLLCACTPRHAVRIEPFSTDGCTLFPEGNWHECCVQHDRDYWCGGTAQQRQRADIALQQCISERGHPKVGALAYLGVRLGGTPWIPAYWRWGYGWPFGHGYRAPETPCTAAAASSHLDALPKPAK